MRKLLLALALSTGTVAVAAQDSVTVYYSNRWYPCEKSQARYYRKFTVKDSLLWVNQYNAKEHYLELSGSYRVKDTMREGLFTEYYKNGFKKSEGYYTQNLQVGAWTTWYPSGKFESKQSYLSDVNEVIKTVLADSVLLARFRLQKDRPGWYEGLRQGLNTWYHKNGRESAIETYENGRITAAKLWDDQGNISTAGLTDFYDNTQTPFADIQLNNFLTEHVKYPKESLKKGIQGRVVLQFFIEADGKLTDFKVMESPGDTLLDEEAIRVIKMLEGKVKPMVSHNRPQGVYYTLPVSFKIR